MAITPPSSIDRPPSAGRPELQPEPAPQIPTLPDDQGALAPLMRPSRFLIRWLDPAQIELIFAGNELPQYKEAAQRARQNVSRREASVAQPDVLTPIPPMLNDYINAWKASNSGWAGPEWRCEIADLRQVFAAQPHVFTDHATERVDQLESNNLEALAAFTIPQPIPAQITG